MRIFGSIDPQNEHIFSFHYIIILKTWTFYQPSDVATKIHVGEQRYLRYRVYIYMVKDRIHCNIPMNEDF